MLKLTAPEGATSVSHDGQTYEVEDGVVVVPHAAGVVLIESHGYTVAIDQGAPDDGLDTLTKAQLQEQLTVAGVAFDNSANKAALVEALRAFNADKPAE